jgi:hypothetical protein
VLTPPSTKVVSVWLSLEPAQPTTSPQTAARTRRHLDAVDASAMSCSVLGLVVAGYGPVGQVPVRVKVADVLMLMQPSPFGQRQPRRTARPDWVF